MSEAAVERIMLIDDEQIDHMMYKRIIGRSDLGCELVSFMKAGDAIEYLKDPDKPPVDLIFLDIRMPLISGFDFLEMAEPFMPKGRTVPVIMMLTTSLNETDRKRAASFERVKAYFNKPLNADQLTDAVKIVADAKAAKRDAAA